MLSGIGRPSHVNQRRHDVDQMSRLGRNAAWLSLQSLRPMRDHRRLNATLMLVLFVQTVGRVADVCPAFVVGPIGTRVPGVVLFAPGPLERTSAIVGAKHE